MAWLRTSRARQSCIARRQPCRECQERGDKATHHAQKQLRAIASETQLGKPAKSGGQTPGAVTGVVMRRKSRNRLPLGNRHGISSSDQGHNAASSRPTSVPGTVIASGMFFSSQSISEATSMSEMKRQVGEVLAVQNVEQKGGRHFHEDSGQQPDAADFPGIKCGKAQSGRQLYHHRPDPEAAAVQGRLPPQTQPAEDRQAVDQPPWRGVLEWTRPGTDRPPPPCQSVDAQVNQAAGDTRRRRTAGTYRK